MIQAARFLFSQRMGFVAVRLGFFAAFFMVAGVLFSPHAGAAEVRDPLEPFNRKIFAFNQEVDRLVLKPVAQGYEYILPRFVRTGINNFFDNLLYPTVFVNQFLQGKFRLAVQDFGRFAINSTMGIGGLFDVASEVGLMEHDEDFGQTFGVWGMTPGPYLVVPLWGPSTLRDGIGEVAGLYTNPMFYLEDETTRYVAFGLSLIDTRAELLGAEKLLSGDEYLFMRDAYLQRRDFLINDGEQTNDPFLDAGE
jgi:phospholipid-binding lipoprotein MlaA